MKRYIALFLCSILLLLCACSEPSLFPEAPERMDPPEQTWIAASIQQIGSVRVRNAESQTWTLTDNGTAGDMPVYDEDLADQDLLMHKVSVPFSEAFVFETERLEEDLFVLYGEDFRKLWAKNLTTATFTAEALTIVGTDMAYNIRFCADVGTSRTVVITGENESSLTCTRRGNAIKISAQAPFEVEIRALESYGKQSFAAGETVIVTNIDGTPEFHRESS